MKYFPAFLKLDQSKILIVGGGKIATEKIEKVLDFTTNVEVIADHYSEEMLSHIIDHNLCYKTKKYETGDVEGFDIVIIAVNSLEIQEQIYKETRQMRTLCNAVDSVAYCDFIFPSYVKEGDLTIAISTSGTSPAIAKYLKYYIAKVLPQNLNNFLEEMKKLRAELPKGEERMKTLSKKAKAFFEGKDYTN
jgi:precorrin-2 dehydrogenase/sirohydrochlorin ferrochelatase